jgi:AraC-like DNA-binding protein
MFRQSQGISPIDYIQQRRVEKAAALLARPELSVKEVADRVGIWNLSQFNHLFKKIMKKSPTDFRKNTAPARKRPLETIGTVVMRTEVAHSNRYRPKLKRIAIGKNAASS